MLKFLQKVTIELAPDSDNFTIKFSFAPNDHFSNTELSKTFIFKPAGEGCKHHHHHGHDHNDHDHEHHDEDFPIKTEGTHIQWKEGKDITKKTVEKK